MKRALVVSGGGSKGAWGGGIIEYLTQIKCYNYKIFVGTSTGAILSTLTASEKIEEMKEQYTTSTQDDIFSYNPFTKRFKINILKVIWRLIRNKKSIGVMGNLYKTLKKTFTIDDYMNLILDKKSLTVCTTDYEDGETEYFNNYHSEYKDFIKGVYASASVPLFNEPVIINDIEYLDGGVIENIPIQRAINEGATEIDVIIHKTNKKKKFKNNNIFKIFLNTISIMNREIGQDDIDISKLKAKEKDVKLNMYFLQEELTDNALIFKPEEMKKWWKMGFEYAKNKNQKTIIVKK
jgi:predicted patatin/cPLA2 family phospholipase